MNKKEYVNKQIELLQTCIDNNISISELERRMNVHIGYFYDILRRKVKVYTLTSDITQELANKYINLYESARKHKSKKNKNTQTVEIDNTENIVDTPKTYISNINEQMEEENFNCSVGVKYIRSDTDNISQSSNIGRIDSYLVTINNSNEIITYELSRDDMECIYAKYSRDGQNLSQKQVLRNFPTLTKKEFKKILTTCDITKDSPPYAPHELEESNEEDLLSKTLSIRENSFFTRLEAEKVKYLEKRIYELKTNLEKCKTKESYLKNIDLSNIEPYTPKTQTESQSSLFLYISDCHVGAYVDNRSIYTNPYDKNEFNNRLDKIVDLVKQLSKNYWFDKIVVCNLGDSLDGYYGKTTRGGHNMPQNMDNKEQFEVFTKGMIRFFDSLYELEVSNTIQYLCVGEDNHSGDFGWAANATIEAYLRAKYPNMYIKIFKKFIGTYNHGKHTLVLTHGKDATEMFKNLPLTLNDKAENFLNEYINSLSDIRDNVHIIKGDLHQSSTNYCNTFRYKNVGSLFGSSKWIHHNFGNTKACLDYDIIESNTNNVVSGRIVLN